MPSFTITATRQQDETVFTDVTYTLDDGTSFDVSIPHWAPKSQNDVILGIKNRFVSEMRKREDAAAAAAVVNALPDNGDI